VWVRRSAEIWHYPDGTPLTLDPEVAKIGSFKIFADRQANLWVITSDKLFRYNGKSWLLVASPPLGWIDVITTAPDGRLCFATRRGIAVYDPTQDKQP
jgi:ligand-binding sensor domain-containing protein